VFERVLAPRGFKTVPLPPSLPLPPRGEEGDYKFSAEDNSVNIPPEYYGRKAKTQNIRLSEISSLGIMWFNSITRAKPYPI